MASCCVNAQAVSTPGDHLRRAVRSAKCTAPIWPDNHQVATLLDLVDAVIMRRA